jgi:hypothetical protein
MKNLFLLLAFTGFISSVTGQSATKTAQTSKAPQYRVSWGGYAGGNINAEQFKKLVDSPLVVKDGKGNKYAITRFRINYSFLSTYKDSESQMMQSIRDLRVFDFYDTPTLSEVWRASIRDNAKKGDSILINNIIIRQKNGKKTLSPDWKAGIE